ncbi:MAG: hypothetical protein C0623_03995 [Desulfuromonas sp.]|nr:MAG: hypothetical protein C0623_03995 [Desulfuromonas sp.]
MEEGTNHLQNRIENLEGQVSDLQQRLNEVESRLDKAGVKKSAAKKGQLEDKIRSRITSDEVINWLDTSFLMPRIATTSFILVLAIALRTLTDSGTIGHNIGSGLGIAYGFILLVIGWSGYGRNSIQAPVFTLWGTIVLTAIIVETHRVFNAIPAELAYMGFILLGLATAVISRQHRVALPILVGTLGMSIGGFAIDYPNPIFPYLVFLLIAANMLTVFATRLMRASWIRWLLLVLTIFMFQIWALKLTIYLGKTAPGDLEFAIRGFLPLIALIGLMYVGISFFGVLGKIQERISKFDVALPVINVIWIFLFSRYVLSHGLGDPTTFGLVASLIALGHLGLAWLIGRREEKVTGGATSFGLAGGTLLAFALPMGIGNTLVSSTILAVVAFGGAWLAQKWESGGIRYVSYLMQIYAAGALILALSKTEMSQPSLIGATASALMAAIAIWHYYWCRENPPTAGMETFKTFDKKDRGAAFVLVAALLSGFFTVRVGIYQGLAMLGFRSSASFSSGQSVLIIGAAAIMMYLGVRLTNRELRTIGILLLLAGACKVFLSDVISLNGMPLMVSLFSFGLCAIFIQFMNHRWSKKKKEQGGAVSGP